MMVQSTALIVFISTILGHTGSAVTPVVTFTPNWRKIFIGESITMTCDVGSSGGRGLTYYWYKDGNWVHTGKIYTIRSAKTWDSGDYRCRASTARSYTARLDVVLDLFEIPEIKVTPDPVVEGDEMTLTCDTSLSLLRPRTQLKFAFHKDGRNVREFTSYNKYGVQSTQVKDSGKYSCEVSTATNSVQKRSREILVEIKELFVNPTIRAIRYPTTEGDHMILMCFSLSLHRPGTELQFSFYRDGRNVQEFSSSHQYEVQSAQLKDSGNYSCDVGALNGKVMKNSNFIPIMIKELFFSPVLNVSAIEVLEGGTMTLTCNTSLSPPRQRAELQFAFYRDGWNVQNFNLSDQYGVQSTQLEDSGNYFCEVRSASNISKKSEDVFVQIRGEKNVDYTLQNLIRLLASGIIILIGSFIFYSHMKTVRVSKTKNVEDTEEMAEEHQL